MQPGSKGCGATNNRIIYVEDYSQQGAAGVKGASADLSPSTDTPPYI